MAQLQLVLPAKDLILEWGADMKGSTIRVATEFGTNLTSRSLGRQLRRQVVGAARAHGWVMLDFLGVASATDPFIRELIVGLAEDQGSAWLSRHVRLQNLSPELDSDVRSVLRRWETARPQKSTERRAPSQL